MNGEINIPEVVAEVRDTFERYEAALMSTDVEVLSHSFWESDLTVRYGVAECLYSVEEIRTWRLSAAPLPPGRKTGPTVIATFGRDVACVSTEFRNPGSAFIGRQSQTWIRFPDGWRIVAAHVSLIPAERA